MAVLTALQRAELRNAFGSRVQPTTWSKAEVNAALQAIEDWFEANRTSLGTAIETAAPTKFTAQQKKLLVAVWLLQKFSREVV